MWCRFNESVLTIAPEFANYDMALPWWLIRNSVIGALFPGIDLIRTPDPPEYVPRVRHFP